MSTNLPINPLMAWFQRQNGTSFDATAADRRRDYRYPTQHALSCELGKLADLSTTGMRIITKSKPIVAIGQEIDLSVQTGQQRLPLRGVIVRLQRKGIRAYDVGVRFVGIDDRKRAIIESLAQYGYVDTTSSAFKAKKTSKRKRSANAARQVSASIENPYKTLGVSDDASEADIRKAYSKLAFKYHPDVSNEPESARIFKQVHDAYTLLRDPERKKKIDHMLASAIQ